MPCEQDIHLGNQRAQGLARIAVPRTPQRFAIIGVKTDRHAGMARGSHRSLRQRETIGAKRSGDPGQMQQARACKDRGEIEPIWRYGCKR